MLREISEQSPKSKIDVKVPSMPINAELATEQWMRYSYCRDRGHLQFLEKANQCEEFFAGNQWSQTDINALRLQRRPALTINKILSTLATVFGVQI